MFIDVHAHYDDKKFDEDRYLLLEEIHNSGCEAIVDAGVDIETAGQILEMAEKVPYLYTVLGIHPLNLDTYREGDLEIIEGLLSHPKVVGVGEIGLDYHYDDSNKEEQKAIFRELIRMGKRNSMPIVVHDREAHQDCFDILKEEKAEEGRTLIHCYSGSAEMAEILIRRGYLFSFGGVVTFKNAKKTVEAVSKIPLDRILLETDSPYLSPEPHRGERNDSSKIPFIARKIAEIKGKTVEEIYEITTKNAKEFYKLP